MSEHRETETFSVALRRVITEKMTHDQEEPFVVASMITRKIGKMQEASLRFDPRNGSPEYRAKMYGNNDSGTLDSLILDYLKLGASWFMIVDELKVQRQKLILVVPPRGPTLVVDNGGKA